MIEVLFPKNEQKSNDFLKVDSINLFNNQLNSEQIKAVERIMKLNSPHPFILFGPPGTGKSKTMIESIKQVWKNSPDSFIIVAAHSNVAVDLLLEELIRDIPYDNIKRIASKSWIPQMSGKIRKYTTNNKDAIFGMKKLRILCGTLQILGSVKISDQKNVSHLFIDEAGQTSEPDVLIPWTQLLSMIFQYTY